MKNKITDDKSHNTQTNIKEKRKRKVKIEEKGNANANGDVKLNDIDMLEKSSSCKENGVIKKRKKKHETDSFMRDVNSSECAEEFAKEVSTKFEESIEMENTKSLKNVEGNNKDEMTVQVKELDGKSLRASFNSASALETLKKFVKICNNSNEKDLAAEYLDAGGNIIEVLKLLDTSDNKKNIGAVTTVFSAIRILLIKILAQYPQQQSSAEAACRHLINSHLSMVHSMLSVQSNAKQRKVVLQLLAVIVSLGGNLPRELLTHLSLLPEIIKSLVRQTKPTDEHNIRNCFIHFILSFLIEGNVSTIRTLLDKHNLLSSIFHDMIYDSKDIIALIITTLKTYILQNSKISKSMKLHIFSTSVIQNFVRLYNWKGPNNWPKNKIQNFKANPQYLEEKEIVTDTVHSFLIILFTSHRHGIVFYDRTLGTSHAKHNQLVSTILQSLDRPWEHEKPSDLVIKIMTACPDLIKSQFSLLEPHIEPRVSTKWIATIRFVRKIIESVDIGTCLKTCSMELSVSQLANAIMSLTLPQVILKNAVIPSLSHSNIVVRHEAVLTLTTMFDQMQKYLIVARENYNKDSDFNTFKNTVLELMIKNVPNLNMILKLWSLAFVLSPIQDSNVNTEHIPEPKKYEHLTAILNLLHKYEDISPKLLHTLSDLQPSVFLNTLNELHDVDLTEFNTIKVKTIQFLVMSNPTEFSPQQDIFSDVLSYLISLLNREVFPISLSIKTTIKILLNTTGMFEGCSDQIDIWINGFVNIDEKEEIINWFINILKKAAKDVDKYVNEIIKTEEIINEGIIPAGRLEDIFNELADMDIIHESLEKNVLRMQRLTSISPVLCYILRKMKTNLHPTTLCYASYVLVHTLHYQVAPECLIHLTKDIQELPIKKYLLSWLASNNPVYIKEVLPSMVVMAKLDLVLLSNTKIQINEIFNGDNTVTFKYNNEIITIRHSLSSYEIMCLFKMTIFYLTQFTKRDILTTTQIDNYKILLISLLYLSKESPNDPTLLEECIKSVFTHPIVLYNFLPFHQKDKNIVKSMMTDIIIAICNVIIHWYRKEKVEYLVFHFKNKLLTQLHKMINKRQRSDKIDSVEAITTLLNLLQVTPQDVVCLLKKLMALKDTMFISKNEKNLSIYGYIVPKLLEIISNNEIQSERNALFELDAEFIKCLCSHLLVLKSKRITNFEKWESALHEYISKFPFNIVGIDTDIFLSLLATPIKDTTVKLLSFLIGKNMKFIPIFTEYMLKSESIKESNIVFPILQSNLNFKWNQKFLQELRTHYQYDVLSYLSKPTNTKVWIEENATAVSYLIENVFDLKMCSETCNIILQIGDKLDMVSIQYIQILQSVYNKCATCGEDGEKHIMNLVQVLVHIITLTLKKESKNIEKLLILCKGLNAAVKYLREKKEDFLFEALHTSNSWSQFTRFSLKFGFKELKGNKQPLQILKTLSILCDVAYKNGSNSEYAKTLFEMATSHSEFLNIMLLSSDIKRNLVELLWVLIQKNKTVIAITHVPVYLAAYNATLSAADQYLLLILQYYESNGINIYEYRPYLWGNAAATHYSVKGETHMNLWREPSTFQVLNLFEEDIVNNTIKNYPIDRALKNIKLHDASNTYDPAFYLPLLYFLLAENNVVSCQKIAQSGALGLTFAACSSNHSDIRMIAYTIIVRYYSHLEASRSKARLLWMRLIDALRYGVISLHSQLNDVRLNCIVSIFLARASLIATQPLHPLYLPLQIFLMAKPALDINTIPELLQLFHSSDVKHKEHRHWILETIRDGMRTKNELNVAFKCVLFKMLLGFYTCNLPDPSTKTLILEVIDSTLKINSASILLIEGYGLLPWLLEITNNLHSHEIEYIEFIVKIMDTLLNTILRIEGDTVHYKLMLLNVALSLKSHLSKDIKVIVFTVYINILQRLFLSRCMKMAVSKEYIMEILQFSKNLLGNLDECEDMLRFGCEYISKAECIEDNEIEVARNCLRTMVWTWCSHEAR
ncbi:nucleolar pre-ribosomal-associated protein 1 [Hylaeus volcanicus]|uniref:nucleolar pre-ribosomal-associated protein 1 n=1 Tax=Hylaeus volcanicus TaxID=313075 RepID=UPI0023B8237C|nr:nucleolar pre-ribosomal-associated protein 1 [Hylaeus volcanicus]XP_053970283.1 nucleolar pre-ribosomal-associated protein 1 [Hylaeus volcanicus]